jgi:hypothetical protein
MEQIEIKAVELVRHIRDQHYILLQNKSFEEIKAFFRREATAVNAEAKTMIRERTPDGQAYSSIQTKDISQPDRSIPTAT